MYAFEETRVRVNLLRVDIIIIVKKLSCKFFFTSHVHQFKICIMYIIYIYITYPQILCFAQSKVSVNNVEYDK